MKSQFSHIWVFCRAHKAPRSLRRTCDLSNIKKYDIYSIHLEHNRILLGVNSCAYRLGVLTKSNTKLNFYAFVTQGNRIIDFASGDSEVVLD